MAILNIGLDLGSDAVKIAFAVKKGRDVSYGKLARNDFLTQVAIPAVAFYDLNTRSWKFGDEVERKNEYRSSFATVVKIKNLISLLERGEHKADVFEENARYYRFGHDFPKFYFPVRKKMLSNFGEMVKNDLTFCVAEDTPESVCESFFYYLRTVIEERTKAFTREKGIPIEEYRLALVYPPKVGGEYVEELMRLAQRAFGIGADKVLSSTKALGMFAYHRGALASGESVLVFDMGDENISVARVSLIDETVVVDGADGHSAPLAVGGQDVDEVVASYLEGQIAACETVGTPSFGEEGHIRESGLYSKQYLFMKEIKKAKIVLSRPLAECAAFRDGVPVAVNRDVYIQRRLTREAFADCLGMSARGGLAETIASYIVNEIRMPANRGVQKIFLSGGLAETYGLLDYLERRIGEEAYGVAVGTFDDGRETDDGFTVLSHEDSVYAPAVGAAIVALRGFDVRTAVALSYGTWAIDPATNSKILSVLADRGSVLKERGTTTFGTRFHIENTLEIRDEEMFSAAITKQEIRDHSVRGLTYTGERVMVGEINSQPRLRAARLVGLKTVTGGVGSLIEFYYSGRKVKILDRIYFREGIHVDPEGHATPFFENASGKEDRVNVLYVSNGARVSVKASEIELRFYGMDAFKVVAGE